MKKWVIARPINGISINGDEYAIDDDGKYVCFDSKEEAETAICKAFPFILIASQCIYPKEIEVEENVDIEA